MLRHSLLLSVLGATVLLLGCEDSPPPPKVATKSAPAAPAAAPPRSSAALPSYALQAGRNDWPPLGEGAAQPAVSGNLLASNYYVVLDGSGSMKRTGCSGSVSKLNAARTALASFAQSVPADANLGLSVFDAAGFSERLPLGPVDRAKFTAAVNQVRADGGTPLKAAVDAAYRLLLEQARLQLGYGEYHLVIVTDGQASDGQDPTVKVNDVLARSPVMFHTIGFCIDENHSLNQRGRTSYRTADDVEALRRGLEAVLAEAPSFDVSAFGD